MIEKAWAWEKVKNDYWEIPDEYMYYLANRWSDSKPTTVLDLGCGIGRHAMLFAKNGYDVTALDISSAGIDIVAKKARENNLNIKTILANIVDLPLLDDSFNNIVAFNSIYHTDTNGFKKVIKELKRILKVDGEIFLTLLSKQDPSYEKASKNIVDTNTRMKSEEDGSELPHFFVDYDDIAKLFEDFKIVSIKEITEFFNSQKHIHFNVLLKLEGKDD